MQKERPPAGLDADGLAAHLRKRLHERSALIAANNELIHTQLRPLLAGALTADEADALFNLAERLYAPGKPLDMFLALEIHLRLIESARETKDNGRLIRNLHCAGYLYMQMCAKAAVVDKGILYYEEALAHFTEGAAFRAAYAEITDKETRRYINRCLGNVYVILGTRRDFDPDGMGRLFLAKVDEALHFWHDEKVRAMDPDFPWEGFINNAHQNICNCVSILRRQEPENRDLKLAMRLYNSYTLLAVSEHNVSVGGVWTRARTRYIGASAHFFIGKISSDQLIRELREIFYDADDQSYSSENLYSMLFIPGIIIRHLMDGARFITRWITREIDAITARIANYLKNVPPGVNHTMLDSYIATYARYIGRALGEGGLLALLQEITVNTSFQGYVQTTQTAEIARILTAHLLTYAPRRLIGLCGATTEAEVGEKAGKILAFLQCAVLCHGIEKTFCSDVNYLCARTPDAHARLLMEGHANARILSEFNAEETREAIEVIRGHHKWYDNQGGYPAEYDRGNAPCTAAMDILAIAESIEAATDDLHRTHIPLCTLSEITEEIRAQSGTRYAPYAAEALTHPEVITALEECITTGRKNTAFAYYTRG